MGRRGGKKRSTMDIIRKIIRRIPVKESMSIRKLSDESDVVFSSVKRKIELIEFIQQKLPKLIVERTVTGYTSVRFEKEIEDS